MPIYLRLKNQKILTKIDDLMNSNLHDKGTNQILKKFRKEIAPRKIYFRNFFKQKVKFVNPEETSQIKTLRLLPTCCN